MAKATDKEKADKNKVIIYDEDGNEVTDEEETETSEAPAVEDDEEQEAQAPAPERKRKRTPTGVTHIRLEVVLNGVQYSNDEALHLVRDMFDRSSVTVESVELMADE